MMTGKVTRVFIGKGYGFIAGDDKKDYFFHMSSVDPAAIAFRHLSEGTAVRFNPNPPVSPGKNLQAKEVQLNDINTPASLVQAQTAQA